MTDKGPEPSGWDGWEARGIANSQLDDAVFRRHGDDGRREHTTGQSDVTTPEPMGDKSDLPGLEHRTPNTKPDDGYYG